MLLERLRRRRMGETGGAFSLVAVDASRATTSRSILGLNIDDAVSAGDLRLADAWRGDGEWITAPQLFLGRNPAGFVVGVIQRFGDVGAANRLGRALVASGASFARLEQILSWAGIDDGLVLCAGPTMLTAWRVERGAVALLSLTNGLLTYSAGHSSADPMPGGGWLIDRLDWLHAQQRVAEFDVERALRDVRLGDSTACSIVVYPGEGRAHMIAPTAEPVRQSA